ncbi:hypothetical protein B0J14DRAFT_166923 [Halenospora varia]|nr:hypothetical protein B0J14DRAFT_166923 [Halenospora varia]
MSGKIWNIMGDESSHKDPYDHNASQKEKRRIQNKLNQRRHRRRLKLAAAGSFEEPVPNGHRNTTDNGLQPTNTYQLRGRNVLSKCGQPPLSQKRDHEYTRIACEGPVDRSQMESTSDESSRISNVFAEGSETPVYQSQYLQQTKGQHIEDSLGQSLHTRNYTQSDINTVQPVPKAPQQHRTPSNEPEFSQPMLTTTTPATAKNYLRDRTVDLARGALGHLLSISPDSQYGGDSQTNCIPARPMMYTQIPSPTQDLNATLAQFRTSFQQVFEFVQMPLNKLQDRATSLEQELYRRRSETMRLGRYTAWMMIDIESILETIAGIEVDSTVIERLIVELSKAAQKRAEEKVRLHTKVQGLEKNLKALHRIVLDMASPC